MNRVQRIPGLTTPALAFHYVLQETAIIVLGACLYFTRWQQAYVVIIARAATTNLAVIHLLKLFFKQPRQAHVQSVTQMTGLQMCTFKMQGFLSCLTGCRVAAAV